VRLSLQDAKGNTTIYRLPLPLARAGFLGNPIIDEVGGLMQFAGGIPQRHLARLAVVVDEPDRKYFSGPARVKISRIAASRNAAAFVAEAEKTRFHMFKTVPVAYSAQAPLSDTVVDGQPVMVLHARSELTFNVREGARVVSGKFGYIPGAYSDGGNTDGAEFVIAWSNGGERIELSRRYLDPVRVAADRGLHSFEVSIPPQLGGRLFLSINPGPSGNFSWDWTVWGGIEIK
jgi:hypothetical protein